MRRWVQVKLLKERWGRKRAREDRVVGRCVWQIRCGRQKESFFRASTYCALDGCKYLPPTYDRWPKVKGGEGVMWAQRATRLTYLPIPSSLAPLANSTQTSLFVLLAEFRQKEEMKILKFENEIILEVLEVRRRGGRK